MFEHPYIFFIIVSLFIVFIDKIGEWFKSRDITLLFRLLIYVFVFIVITVLNAAISPLLTPISFDSILLSNDIKFIISLIFVVSWVEVMHDRLSPIVRPEYIDKLRAWGVFMVGFLVFDIFLMVVS